MVLMKSSLLLVLLGVSVKADLYLQACRGSNNRLDEQGRDRANGNRLFDSQNNNRGGVNVGHLTYYNGETVPISWTNQHSSGKYQLKETEIVLQYTCDPLMRDGTTTNRIPDNPVQCADFNCDTDVEYGRHESFKSYQYCKATSRNKGLFLANQNLNGKNAAIYTRQDSAGTRYGYECPEERDYYPYWRGSMWRDMAIFTNTPERCAAYQEESQNVKSRWECRWTDHYWRDVKGGYQPSRNGELSLDEIDCDLTEKYRLDETDLTEELKDVYEWVEVKSFGLDPPECTQTVTTRANHHGLYGGRTYWTYNWKVPDEILDIDGHDQCCVIRARYNITTGDYMAWESDESVGAGLTAANNTKTPNNPNPNDDPAWVQIWKRFQLTYEDIEDSFTQPTEGNPDADDAGQRLSRGYVFRNDPEVDPFGYDAFAPDNDDDHKSRILLQLAINTDQFGRTFQDRTHCFTVKDRESAGIVGNEATEAITLVTVQGKRGNIVQTYPATEYFFIPEPAVIYEKSWVHFCWTGSDRNPNNNDGQGRQGTDRSNICPLTQQQWNKNGEEFGPYGNVDNYVAERNAGSVGDPGNNYPDWLKEPSYGFPVYYNYAPKRDLPRKSQNAEFSQAMADQDIDQYPFNDPYNTYWFSQRGAVSQMAGLDETLLGALCTLRKKDNIYGAELGMFDYGNMEELDDSGTTFCIQPVKVKNLGTWNFLSTRNNNFSNRSQKGALVVSNAYSQMVSATRSGYNGQTTQGQARITVPPGYIKDGDSLDFTVTTWLNRGGSSTIVQLSGVEGGIFSADSLSDNGWIELWIPYTPKSLSYAKAWWRENSEDEWAEHSQASVKHEEQTQYGVVQVKEGGYYTITNEPDILAYIACILGVLLFVTAMFFVIRRNCVKPK